MSGGTSGVYSSIIPPPGWGGGGGESKGLRAKEESQRRVKKWKEKNFAGKEKNFGGLSYFIPSWAKGGGGGGKILLDTGRCGKESRPMW